MFGVYMYFFAAAQETSAAKLPAFFLRFQTEEGVLTIKNLKLFRILVILWGLSAKFWDMARFINQSLVSLFQAQSYYTCWESISGETFFIKFSIIENIPINDQNLVLLKETIFR